MPEKKSLTVYNEIKKEIFAGKFGKPGERFITTRALTLGYGVSLVTAQRIMTRLREERLVYLMGKTTYLCYGKVSQKSTLAQKRKKTNVIGLHVVNIDNPYFSALVRAVEEEADRHGYKVITKSSNYIVEEEKRALAHFEALGVDGIISCPLQGKASVSAYKNMRLPFVFMSASVEGVDADEVLINNYAGGTMVAKHLIENGYENFMYVSSGVLKNVSDMRLKGFRDVVEKSGFSLPNENIIYADNTGKVFENHVVSCLSQIKKPLGIFCYHDILGVGVLRICQQYGYSVPSDVGIVGYDNLRIIQDMFPTLSSVDYRIKNLVSSTVELLIKRIDGYEGESEKQFIEPVLTIKGSSQRLK